MRVQGSENTIFAVLEAIKIISVSCFLVGLRSLVYLIHSYLLFTGRLTYNPVHIGHDVEWLLEHLTIIRPPALASNATGQLPTASGNLPSHVQKKTSLPFSRGPASLLRPRTLLHGVVNLACVLGLCATIFDIAAFFALDVEGTDVLNKPEFISETHIARSLLNPRNPTSFDHVSLPPAFNYIARRLPDHIAKFGAASTPTVLHIPDRVDYQDDEKWLVNDPRAGRYATLTFRDYNRTIRTVYDAKQHVVFSRDEQGLNLHPQGANRPFRARRMCSDTVGGARTLDALKKKYEICYSDEPRRTSCAARKSGDIVSFVFHCSEVTIENGSRTKTYNEVSGYAESGSNSGRGATQMLHLNSARADSPFADTSPVLLVAARILPELVTQTELEEREFFLDTTVVVVPTTLVATLVALAVVGVVLIVVHAVVVRLFKWIPTSSWPGDLVAGVLNDKDVLNRRRQKNFHISVVPDPDATGRFKLVVRDWAPNVEDSSSYIQVTNIG